MLIDDVDYSVFGGIYEYHSFAFDCNAPKFVIAFRGTIKKPDTKSRDLKLDLQCISNRLHQSSRFQLSMQANPECN